MTQYQIRFRNKSVQKDWFALVERSPEQMERCLNFLQQSPEDRLKSGGKLKKLKGKLKGILQYDITDSDRVHFRVDTNSSVVCIEYIGSHPK